jgi:hypothetical protein
MLTMKEMNGMNVLNKKTLRGANDLEGPLLPLRRWQNNEHIGRPIHGHSLILEVTLPLLYSNQIA